MQTTIYLQEMDSSQIQSYTQAQKRTQSCLKEYEQTHPEFFGAKKGLSGMLHANEILKAKGDVGVLIGGLLKECWNERATEEDFDRHKDVDVLVLDTRKDYDSFEGGIDWWLPYLFDDVHRKWKNGHDLTLRYNLSLRSGVNWNKPGLYIPTNDDYVGLREHERRNVNKEMGESVEKGVKELGLELRSDLDDKPPPSCGRFIWKVY